MRERKSKTDIKGREKVGIEVGGRKIGGKGKKRRRKV